MPEDSAEVIIIGAGPAGLAVGGCLYRAGISFVMLDSAAEVGSRWAQHYDRLHLHTAKRFSSLPHKPFPVEYPRYVSKQQFLDYLADYAKPFQAKLRLNQTVAAVTRNETNWDVFTPETVYRAPAVVIATGYNHLPNFPEWPGQALYTGQIIHSLQYKHGNLYRDKKVLVVGFGNSGAEIAIDLFEQGARAHMSVRSPVNVTFREVLGVPFQYILIPFNWMPAWFIDAIAGPINALKFGNYEQYGLKKLPYGALTQVKKDHHVPIIDIGIMRLIRQRKVTTHPGIDHFTADGVVFTDGSQESFDTVILATGYRPQLAQYLPNGYVLLDDKGYPLSSGKPTVAPGLYFCGFQNASVGLLYKIGIEARQITSQIKERVHNGY